MNKDLSRNKALFLNTIILGLGVFGSKLLVFLMMPIYTEILSPAEYSMADLISQTANLLMPLACVGIVDGVFRFAMERTVDKKAVLSSGMVVLVFVSVAFALLSPLVCFIDYFRGYVWLIVAYVIFANLHAVFAQYLRARGRTKLFAAQGVINTLLVITFNIVFLVVFNIGVLGYVLSVVVADLVVSVFLFLRGGLYRDIKRSEVDPALIKRMLKYSVPMIPATIFWWITSVSDRYMVTYFSGETVNGLYSAAYKIPTLLTLVSSVFMEAWQYSAVNETNASDLQDRGKGASEFFGSVFSHYQSVMLVAGSAIIALSQVLISVLCADSYFEAWRYVPVLALSAVFSGFTAFVGSVYLVKKKSMMTFLTSMSGAAVNVVLNLLLIPKIEAQGAAIATLISYGVVFVIRAANVRRYVPFSLSLPRMTVSLSVMLAQTLLILLLDKYIFAIQLGAFTVVLVINLIPFVKGTRSLLKNRREKNDKK